MNRRWQRLLRRVALIVASASGLLPGAAAAHGLSAWLSPATRFPERTLIVPSSSVPLSAGVLGVTENGGAVANLTVTPLTAPGAGDFGVVLLIDQGTTMRGTPIARAMDAARALAAQRSGAQQLGIVTFASTPNVLLPLTSRASAIWGALSTTPWISPGARFLPALQVAFAMLERAKVTTGAVILVSDGIGLTPAAVAGTEGIAAAAAANGISFYTVDLQDRHSTRAATAALSVLGDGTFIKATDTNVDGVFSNVWAKLVSGYIVRYQSLQPLGHPVTITLTVNGSGAATSLTYSPPPAPVRHRPKMPARPHVTRSISLRSLTSRLASTPAFAPASGPRTTHAAGVLPAPVQRHAVSFWSSPAGVLGVAGACAVLVGLAVTILLWRPKRRALRVRVKRFIPDSSLEQESESGPRTSLLTRLVHGSGWWPIFVEQVQTARLRRSPGQLIKLCSWTSAGGAALIYLLTGSAALAVLSLPLAPLVGKLLVARAAGKQRINFADQLPSHLQDLAGAIRAGRSIVGAITAVAEAADEPIRSELERAVADESLGRPLEETLHAIGERMGSDEMDQVALIAALNRRSGSNVAESLDRVADSAREKLDMRRELKALTAQARISSRVLTALPAMLLLTVTVIDPQYSHPIFTTLGGIVVLIVCALMVGMGWLVIRRIVRVEA